VELCAPCHARRTELGDYDHTSVQMLDHHLPSVLEADLYHADGQILEEVYVYGSFLQSKMYHNDVRCSDCHDVHSLLLHHEGNDLCLQCHRAASYDTPDHHFHKKIHEGRPSDGALCVKCHMVEQPYMVIDWRADHSFRVPRPDLTREIDVPNACNQIGCHADQTVAWAADHHRRWYGEVRRPHYGRTLAAGRRGEAAAAADLARLAGDALYPAIVRATALSTLRGYPGPTSAAAFGAALADEDPLVRHTAVENVNVGDAGRLTALVAPLLLDPIRAVRMQAAVRLAAAPDSLLRDYQRAARSDALDEYVEAMTYSLDFAFAGHNLGNLYAQLGDTERAAAHYRRAIAVDELFYAAKVNLAILENARGNNAEAERLLRSVLTDFPDQADVAYSLGLLLAEMERVEEAVGYLERAAAGLPDRVRVHLNLGLALQQIGRLDAAETALRRAVALAPSQLDVLYALADHYVKRGDVDAALPIAERMITVAPEERVGHAIKAFVEAEQRRRAQE
jgi:tetratricopeptide (TPR) repeat protein